VLAGLKGSKTALNEPLRISKIITIIKCKKERKTTCNATGDDVQNDLISCISPITVIINYHKNQKNAAHEVYV